MKQLKFEIDKETMRGRPTNGALIAHTADEFLFDFVLVMPGQQPVVSARLVTSPRHAKALLRSLEDNIKRFEARHLVDAIVVGHRFGGWCLIARIFGLVPGGIHVAARLLGRLRMVLAHAAHHVLFVSGH